MGLVISFSRCRNQSDKKNQANDESWITDLDQYGGWKTMPGKEKWQHCGLRTPTGAFYPVMEYAIKDISTRLYEMAYAIVE